MAAKDGAQDMGLLMDLEASEHQAGRAFVVESDAAEATLGTDLVDEDAENDPYAPLAARMRPRSLAEYIGQSHLLGPDKPLRQALERGRCYSMIFWGPPGVGKTTLALLIARSTHSVLEQISAVASGIKDIRAAIERAASIRRSRMPSCPISKTARLPLSARRLKIRPFRSTPPCSRGRASMS